jgi:peptidoglycan hydrolase CwlO-like protein
MYAMKRWHVALLAVSLTVLLFMYSAPSVNAAGERDSLEAEADRLTYEIIELKARHRAAQEERDALIAELEGLDLSIAAAENEVGKLTNELAECQRAYDESLRTLYKRGDVSELEVLLGARELEEVWEDTAYFERILQSEVDNLDRLKSKLSELELEERDLRDKRVKRQRISEALDAELIEQRIGELEARLSNVNASLRALNGGNGERLQPAPDPPAWTVPDPGELLDRIPSQPPLSDFERTRMVYSGYTTCYGAEFHGSPTASGVIFNMYDFTCAHRTLPFGTWLLVTFRGRQTIVQVNDRGPFVPGRVLDLSFGAAQSIGLDGVQWAEFEILIPKGA